VLIDVDTLDDLAALHEYSDTGAPSRSRAPH